MKLFGTSGIRGPADTLFTDDFCRRLGFSFGSWLISQGKTGFIAVAMDPRDSSPRIKAGLIIGLSACGWEIEDHGVIPTPALTYYTQKSAHIGGGLMVTGSHITADLNGVKLFVNGEEVTKDHEPQIEASFSQSVPPGDPSSLEPVVTASNAARDLYLDLLKNLADLPYPKWKIILDTANGTQTQVMRQLLPDLGLDTDCTGDCDIQSPYFVPRDTETQNSFTDLIRHLLSSHADLGVGFDVDGDRVIFIDEKGRYVPGDFSCSLLALASDSASIVTPISTSDVVDEIGKKVYRTPVGSTFVIAAMKRFGAKFGFEPNGGGISSEILYGRDGGTTLIKLLNLLKNQKLSLSSALDALPKYHLFRDKLDCPFSRYDDVYQKVKQKYSRYPINSLDGRKIDFGDHNWLLFRGSGNAPEFRVFSQSPDVNQAARLAREGLSLVKSVLHPDSYRIPSPDILSDQLIRLDSLRVGDSITAFPDQCAQVIKDISLQHPPASCSLVDNIVVSGMGGSALGGRVLASLERQVLKVPLVISTEFHLPNFVGPKSLVVISSYSGNTAESISALAEARARNAQVYILASGGKLAQIAKKDNLPAYIFDPLHNPSGQPRMGLGYNIISLVSLLSRCRLINSLPELNRLPQFLKDRQAHSAEFFSLAVKLTAKIPVLIAAEHLKGAAHCFRNQLNENSKTFACLFDLPEANHHLLEGLTLPKTNPQNLQFIFLYSDYYQEQIKKRFTLTSQVIQKNSLPSLTFSPSGPNPLFETMDMIQSGSYIAYYLALINRIDPGPIPWVDWYKDQINNIQL